MEKPKSQEFMCTEAQSHIQLAERAVYDDIKKKIKRMIRSFPNLEEIEIRTFSCHEFDRILYER